MSERHARVILYDLDCDAPQHNRAAYAKLTTSDSSVSEYRTDECETVAEARDEARRAGWIIKRDGTCICPMCAGMATP